MKITSVLSNLITEQSRFQILYDKLVKPSATAKPTAPGKQSKGAMDLETLKTIIFADPTTRVPQGFDKEGATLEEKIQLSRPGTLIVLPEIQFYKNSFAF